MSRPSTLKPAQIGTRLRRAREAWGMSGADLATRASVRPRDLEAAEARGEVEASVLEDLAGALGGTLEQLLGGEDFWSPGALALKSSDGTAELAIARPALARLTAAGHLLRGLERILGAPDLWRERGSRLGPRAPADPVVKQAEGLASDLRRALNLGDGPIPSIRAVLQRLGIASFLFPFGTHRVDGATLVRAGQGPIVVANHEARGGLVAAMRMTLAHEMAHALFDRPKSGAAGWLESRTPRGEAVEQRANAFAAHLLAPRRAVQAFLAETGLARGNRPRAQHLLALSSHFGMGVEAMAWHLVTCRVWSPADVSAHAGLASPPYASEDDRELRPSPAEARIPIERRGAILARATEALEQRRISLGRWRELLELDDRNLGNALLAERGVELPPESIDTSGDAAA